MCLLCISSLRRSLCLKCCQRCLIWVDPSLKTQLGAMQLHVCLPSLSRNTWKLGDWTAAMTLATRATPDHIIAAFLLRRHTNRLEPSRTRTARACYAATGQESPGPRLKRRTARPQSGPMRKQAALWGWVMIDSLLDYSEALVMNLLHVLVLFSSVWIGLSLSSIVLVPNVQII